MLRRIPRPRKVRRYKRRRGAKRTQAPLVVIPTVKQAPLDIPADLVVEFSDLALARRVLPNLLQLAVTCARDADTDGIFVTICPHARLLAALSHNVRNLRIAAIAPEVRANDPLAYRNVRRFVAAVPQALADYLAVIPSKITGLHIGDCNEDVIESLGPRLSAGSVVVAQAHRMARVYEWCKQHGKELYALARTEDPICYAVMLAN